jgi:hypothetical protein
MCVMCSKEGEKKIMLLVEECGASTMGGLIDVVRGHVRHEIRITRSLSSRCIHCCLCCI